LTDRLTGQLAFIRELDRLKAVIRQSHLDGANRKENTAEHSWHVAAAALALADYAPPGTDVAHAVRLLLIHDIVEIDAGDTYAFDVAGHTDKYEREQAAARRIFGLLPDEQRDQFIAWWEEFEQVTSDASRFANAVDQLLPMLHNLWGDGGSWLEHRPTYEQVYARSYRRVGESGATALWDYVHRLLNRAVEEGWLPPPVNDGDTSA
jgi:putative hydrolase of HD superfamily